jgi:hypothetical protein
MKTQITLRSTFSNTSWFQRGAAVLLVAAALIFTLALILRPKIQAPVAAPSVQQSAPAARRYLLGGHGELVAGVSNAQAAPRITAASPALIGTGSAYDGGTYGATRPAAHTPNLPVVSTGSAYDGGAYSISRPAARTWPGVPVVGTSSVYDGRSYAAPRVAPQLVRNVPALHSTLSAYDGQ